MGTQQLCLKWNRHYSNLLDTSEQLLTSESFVDVTLACEGLSLKAHKLVLSACSPFFQSIFIENPCKHPVVILKGVKYADLKAIIEFMYRGEVSVTRDQLAALLETAQMLQVRGLAEDDEGRQGPAANQAASAANSSVISNKKPCESPSPRRKKRKKRSSSVQEDSNMSDTEQSGPLKMEVPVSPDTIHVEESDQESVQKGCETPQPSPHPNVPEQADKSLIHSGEESDKREESDSKTEEERPESPQIIDIKLEPSDSEERSPDKAAGSASEKESFSDSMFQLPSTFGVTTVTHSSRTLSESHSARNATSDHASKIGDSHLRSALVDSRTTSETLPLRLGRDSHQLPKLTIEAQGFRTLAEADMSSLLQAVPFSLSSESSRGSLHDTGSQDALLMNSLTYEDLAGSSSGQQKDGTEGSGGLMCYSNPSGVAAVAGPSGYQSEEQMGKQQGMNQDMYHWIMEGLSKKNFCPMCKRTFCDKSTFMDHMKRHASLNQRHQCSICHKSFNWYSSLKRHRRKTHRFKMDEMKMILPPPQPDHPDVS